MKKLADYAKIIEQGKASPDILADALVEMTAHYAFLTEKHITLKLAKAVFEDKAKFSYTKDGVPTEREKPLSDKSVEVKWRLTKNGEEEYRIKRTVGALEKMMRSTNTILYSFKQ